MPFDHPLMKSMSFEQTLGSIPSGLFVVDAEMRIVYWNKAAEQVTGFTAAEAVGRPCSFMEGIPCGRRCGLLDPEVEK
ncbi:MAG: PAS domain-containing protein, partial [Desulfuromonadales bacterium]|nr:PAS domain-containing protein [Desulfuromonadales bacterium]